MCIWLLKYFVKLALYNEVFRACLIFIATNSHYQIKNIYISNTKRFRRVKYINIRWNNIVISITYVMGLFDSFTIIISTVEMLNLLSVTMIIVSIAVLNHFFTCCMGGGEKVKVWWWQRIGNRFVNQSPSYNSLHYE